jgi:hypothetical protein
MAFGAQSAGESTSVDRRGGSGGCEVVTPRKERQWGCSAASRAAGKGASIERRAYNLLEDNQIEYIRSLLNRLL